MHFSNLAIIGGLLLRLGAASPIEASPKIVARNTTVVGNVVETVYGQVEADGFQFRAERIVFPEGYMDDVIESGEDNAAVAARGVLHKRDMCSLRAVLQERSCNYPDSHWDSDWNWIIIEYQGGAVNFWNGNEDVKVNWDFYTRMGKVRYRYEFRRTGGAWNNDPLQWGARVARQTTYPYCNMLEYTGYADFGCPGGHS